MMRFADNLLSLRRAKGATQADIAIAIGAKQTTYSSWETSKVTPPLDKIIAIANYFSVSLDELCGRESKTRKSMDIKLDSGAFTPTRAHTTDAGLDLRSPENIYLKARQSVTIRTGVHIKLPPNTYGRIASKSGLMVHHGILTDGTVDEGFSGEICVCLFNLSDAGYYIEKGDKIAQIIVTPCEYVDVNVVDEIEGGERGAAGFGSTGK